MKPKILSEIQRGIINSLKYVNGYTGQVLADILSTPEKPVTTAMIRREARRLEKAGIIYAAEVILMGTGNERGSHYGEDPKNIRKLPGASLFWSLAEEEDYYDEPMEFFEWKYIQDDPAPPSEMIE